MSWVASMPRDAVEKKPPHGSPCNRCGCCCFGSKCGLGAMIYSSSAGPCPALERVDGGYECGVVRNPRKFDAIRTAINGEDEMRKAALLLTRAGQGCDARINGEPVNHAFNQRLDRDDRKRRREWREAAKLWGINLPTKGEGK